MQAPKQDRLPMPAPAKRAPGEPQRNYTKVPNAYDVLIRDRKLSGSIQRDILWITMRCTWGSEDRTEWAEFTLAEIAEKIGGVERTNISSELADLVGQRLSGSEDLQSHPAPLEGRAQVSAAAGDGAGQGREMQAGIWYADNSPRQQRRQYRGAAETGWK